MISLADFQHLSVAIKITMVHQQRFYMQTDMHASEEVPCINYNLLIDGTSFR